MQTSDRNRFPRLFTLQMQPFLLVAKGPTNVSRRVLFVTITTKAGVPTAVLARRLLLMKDAGYFSVDLDLTEGLFDRILDAGRATRGWNMLVFAFIFEGEDRTQMMGGERATDVLVDVPSGAHFKSLRT